MEKFNILVISVLFFVPLLHGGITKAARNQDGSEEWGYVEVRPKAHMFWWLYRSPFRVEDSSKPWPVILWLQGGPGASGVGIGNFEEVGPLDTYLKPRNSTWLKLADLLFVDNPVGTGFSYVEDRELLVKTDEEAATDLTTLLMEIFNRNASLQKSPLSIVAESYGGKFAVTLGLSALKAIESGKLKLQLGGFFILCSIGFNCGHSEIMSTEGQTSNQNTVGTGSDGISHILHKPEGNLSRDNIPNKPFSSPKAVEISAKDQISI